MTWPVSSFRQAGFLDSTCLQVMSPASLQAWAPQASPPPFSCNMCAVTLTWGTLFGLWEVQGFVLFYGGLVGRCKVPLFLQQCLPCARWVAILLQLQQPVLVRPTSCSGHFALDGMGGHFEVYWCGGHFVEDLASLFSNLGWCTGGHLVEFKPDFVHPVDACATYIRCCFKLAGSHSTTHQFTILVNLQIDDFSSRTYVAQAAPVQCHVAQLAQMTRMLPGIGGNSQTRTLNGYS